MKRSLSALTYVLVGIAFVASVFPFYWVWVTSFESASAVFAVPPHILPPTWHVANYVQAWAAQPWLRALGNTVFIAGVTAVLAMATALLAGYALGMLEFRGRDFIFAAILGMLIVPDEVRLIPDYLIIRMLHWLDTYQAQIIPWGASVFGIFLVRQFFLSFPRELYQAARIDGCGRMRFLWSVGMPLARVPLVIVGIYIFLGSWNSFIWPLVVTHSVAVQPVQILVSTFVTANGTDWNLLSAAVVFTTLPVIIVFLLAQRQFVQAIMQSGIRG